MQQGRKGHASTWQVAPTKLQKLQKSGKNKYIFCVEKQQAGIYVIGHLKIENISSSIK